MTTGNKKWPTLNFSRYLRPIFERRAETLVAYRPSSQSGLAEPREVSKGLEAGSGCVGGPPLPPPPRYWASSTILLPHNPRISANKINQWTTINSPISWASLPSRNSSQKSHRESWQKFVRAAPKNEPHKIVSPNFPSPSISGLCHQNGGDWERERVILYISQQFLYI